MKIMADLDGVNLGMDENEADIAEELQDFDESFDTRSEASESGSESSGSESQPSISSVSTGPTSVQIDERTKLKTKGASKALTTTTTTTAKENNKRKKSSTSTKRHNEQSPTTTQNGKAADISKKKRSSDKTTTGQSGNMAVPNKKSSTKSSTDLSKKNINEHTNSKKQRKKQKTSNNAATTSMPNSGGVGNASELDTTASANGAKDMKDITNVTNDNIPSAKSDESEAEERSMVAPPPPTFESDSESVDSDAAANVKRNGRKAISKSASPEKKASSISAASGNSGKNKSYDYMTKLNYLFRDTRFFLIKSNNLDNVELSKDKSVWATLPQNDANLNQAFKEARNVLLIFSVNESGKFAGFARMSAPSSRDIPQVAWVLPPSISPKALGGVIQLDWICRKELSFNCTSHLYNSWNEGKPVKIGRDGQEIEPKVGAELCRLFPEDEDVELTPILRKSKETARVMREKGIRVIYKPPRSLSSRGGGGNRGSSIGSSSSYRNGGGGGGGGGGPMRHKRTYGNTGGPHRPYKLPPMGPPPSGFKRGSSPYRGGGGSGGPGGGIGNSRGPSMNDPSLPPWERYINSAAAEAYVADYMRTMHGQLPPLPFVPPFGQLPMPTTGPGGAAMPPPGATPYDQLPPAVRYYDGPPLPDYPPPQPIRPPPPGFDKPPSYEDFAAWKNAGLPTVPPPGFPGLSASNGSVSGIGSNSNSFSSQGSSMGISGSSSGAGGGGGGGRNQRESNSNLNRSRERGGGGPGARDYRGGGPADRERHFRGERGGGGHRGYRDSRR